MPFTDSSPLPPALVPVEALRTEYFVWWVVEEEEEEVEEGAGGAPEEDAPLDDGVTLRRFLAGVEEVEVRLREDI